MNYSLDIKNLRHWAIIAFICLCPIVYTNVEIFTLRDFQERSFQLGAMALFSLFVGNLWIGAFLLWNVISLLLNDFTVGLPQVLNVFVGCVLFAVSRCYFKKNESSPYLKALLWVGVLNLLWMILQVSGIDPLYIAQDAAGHPVVDQTFKDASGLFGIKMANAMFLAILLPIVASISVWLTPLFLLPLYFTRSSVAALAVFISMAFYLYHIHRKAFIWFVGIGVLAGATYCFLDLKDDPKTFKSRFPIWHMALKYSLYRPIGYGPDSYRSYTKQKSFLFYGDSEYNPAILSKISDDKAVFKYYDMDNGKMARKNKDIPKNMELNWWDNPHNEYVQQLFEYGVIGLVILAGLFYEMWHRFKFAVKSKELIVITSCLLVYFVSGLGHFPLHLARLACLFPILLGIFYARTDEHEPVSQ